MSACVLWFGEEEGHSLAHRGTDYYLVREESCVEQDVPHIVFFFTLCCKRIPTKTHVLFMTMHLPAQPPFFSIIHHSELVDTTWSFTVFLVACTKRCEV